MTHIVATTKVFILNEKDELLVLRIGVHTKQPERSYTNDLPGGFVDEGEFEREGTVREVKEETDIDLDVHDLKLIWSETGYHEDHDVSVTHLIYLVTLDHTPEVTVSWEHESCEWVPIAEAAEKFDQQERYKEVTEYLRKHKLADARPLEVENNL